MAAMAASSFPGEVMLPHTLANARGDVIAHWVEPGSRRMAVCGIAQRHTIMNISSNG